MRAVYFWDNKVYIGVIFLILSCQSRKALETFSVEIAPYLIEEYSIQSMNGCSRHDTLTINVKSGLVDIHPTKAGLLFEQIANNPSVRESQQENTLIYIGYENGYLSTSYSLKDLEVIEARYKSEAYQSFKDYQIKNIDGYTYYFFDDVLTRLYQKDNDEAFNITFTELLEDYFNDCIQGKEGKAREILVMLDSFFQMEQNANKYPEQQVVIKYYVNFCTDTD